MTGHAKDKHICKMAAQPKSTLLEIKVKALQVSFTAPNTPHA